MLRIDPLSLHLLNTYLFDKLRAGGALAQGEPDYQVETCIEEFWIARRPPLPPLYTMKLSIEIRPVRPSVPHLVVATTHQWAPRGFYIDDKVADAVTNAVIGSLSRGLVSVEEQAGETAGNGP